MIIRPPEPADRPEWERLYAGYADFYKVTQTPEMRATVWGWIHDPAHGTRAFVAEDQGRLVGLAHFRPFARPLSASTGGFLDDLFVDPTARGSGAADALIAALADEGRKQHTRHAHAPDDLKLGRSPVAGLQIHAQTHTDLMRRDQPGLLR